MSAVLDAYMAASRAVFILQIPLIGLCLVGCLLIKDRGLHPIEEAKPDDTSSESRDEEMGQPSEKSSHEGNRDSDRQVLAQRNSAPQQQGGST